MYNSGMRPEEELRLFTVPPTKYVQEQYFIYNI